MILELRTVTFIVTALFLIQTFITFLVARLVRPNRGMGAWTIGAACATSATLSYGFYNTLPTLYTVVLGNSFYAISVGCFYEGICQFLERPLELRKLYLIRGATIIVVLCLPALQHNLAIQALLISALITAFMGASALMLYTYTPRMLHYSHLATGTILLLFAGIHSIRIVLLLLFPVNDPVALNHLFVMPMISAAIGGVLWTAGIALMITERLVEELKFTATHDFLTDSFNRRAAHRQLEVEIARIRHHAVPLSILLLDLDHFKNINDKYGHSGGDAVLVAVSQQLTLIKRPADMIARWGGEEFLMILPNTSAHTAYCTARNIRDMIAGSLMQVEGKAIAYTVSIGVATTTPSIVNVDDLLRHADHALYHAKHTGRNCVSASAASTDGLRYSSEG